MKQIAYIELDTHAEIAAQFMTLMQDSKLFEVDYFFSSKIAQRLKDFKTSEVFISSSSSILQQLAAKSYDLIIIGSVHRYFNLFNTIVSHFPSAIIVHNSNFSNASKTQLLKGIIKEDSLYRLKLLLKEGLLSAPKVYQKAAHLLVLDVTLANEKRTVLPIFFNRFPCTINHPNLSIVIPGEVSQKRRDYHHVFTMIKTLKPQEKIQLVFLGKAAGSELNELEQLQKSINPKIEILFFAVRVPQDLFDEYMQKADVLWCPIQKENEFLGIQETYGKTKVTGNLGDAIAYGKWAIFPKDYPSQFPFIINEKENLLELINSIKAQKFDFQKEFGQEKTLEKLEKTLMNLIKT